MTEQPEKEQKRSFVGEKDVPLREERPETSPVTFIKVNGKDVPLLKPEIVPTLMYGKLCEILDELKMLNNIFKEAKQPTSFQNPAPTIQQTEKALGINTNSAVPSASVTQTPLPTEQTPRVKEILAALEPVKDLLVIDLNASAMFVMVKPASFLGPDNFANVAKIIHALDGHYMSAGKNSHFEIPKAPLRK